ncbi:hypothetical protein F750_4364 [Streptomyces sp. PAMC 26508]|nr:hypothetical protein F750_4364 [Streptomyces sp. PAMC 26508]
MLLGGRRGAVLPLLEAGQETVVKEAAHRLTSLGGPTDSPGRIGDNGQDPCAQRNDPTTEREIPGSVPAMRTTAGKRSRKRIGHIEHQPSQGHHDVVSVLRRVPRTPLRRTAPHGHPRRIRTPVKGARNRGPTRSTGVNRPVSTGP